MGWTLEIQGAVKDKPQGGGRGAIFKHDPLTNGTPCLGNMVAKESPQSLRRGEKNKRLAAPTTLEAIAPSVLFLGVLAIAGLKQDIHPGFLRERKSNVHVTAGNAGRWQLLARPA